MTFSHRALHAFKWSILGEAVTRVIGPLSFLILARLLVPEDFGVVAAATVVISFSQVFSDAGLAKALIQRRDRTEESANVVFWLNLGIGTAVVLLLYFLAPQIGAFFKDSRIVSVIRVLSLQIIFAAFSSVHIALLQKNLNYKQLFWVRLTTTFVPALIAIPLALQGMSYWALVASSLVGQILQSLIFWLKSAWRPRWGLDRQLALQLLTFGKWAMLSGVLGWFYGWMDAIVVGHYLGAHDMGLYRTGNTFVTLIFGLIFAPLLPVLYSLFSELGHDRDFVSRALMSSAASTMLLSLPVAGVLVLCGNAIELQLFGANWSGLAPIIGLLAIGQGLAWLVGANGEAYRAINRPDFESWAMGLSTIIYLCAYLISIQFGLLTFVIVRVVLVFVGISLQILIANRAFGLSPMSWVMIAYKPILFSAIAFLIASQINVAQTSTLIKASLQSGTMLIMYGILVMIFDQKQLKILRRYFNAT